MDTRLIYSTSEKIKLKIDWIKPADTEWIYCGAAGEVKWDVVAEELNRFFDGDAFYIATTRTNSFPSDKDGLLSSIQNLVGKKNFIIWCVDFQKAVEFHQIGVFRKGAFSAETNHPSLKMSYNKMAPGSPDKVKGKLVKYRKGDCLSIDCNDGKFLATFVSEKFNKYYDFTLIEYCKETKPTVQDFIEGRFFGNYVGSVDGYIPGIQKRMLECLYIDANSQVEKVGSVNLSDTLHLGGYGYLKSIDELIDYYFDDIQLRIQKTINVQKNPNLNQQGDRLIEMNVILKT
jgi:hypothetical protein